MPDTPTAFLLQFDHAETATSGNTPGILAQLTHEMAEPLGAIDAIAYYLRMVLPKEDERTQRQLERIEELVASMNGTLSDAIQYLRQPSPEPEVMDLHALLVESLAERGSNTNPVFHMEISDEPALIRVDAGQGRHLIRSLMNLFRSFASRCEEVVIRTSTEASIVALEFTARSFNATREEVEAMFRPFGNGFSEGSGLSLASVRRIVESNGGRISARSDNGRDLLLRGAFPLAV